MSVNGANPVGEVEEPPIDNNGIDYGTYASTSDTAGNSSEEINFSSKDISKREKTKFFTRVEGSEKRAREEERKIAKHERELRVRMLKEAEKKDRRGRRFNKEEVKNLHETEAARNMYRSRKIRELIWNKRKQISIAVVAVILFVLAVIFAPIIINSIQNVQKQAIVAEGKTKLLSLFSSVAGKEYSKESFEAAIGEGNDFALNYYDVAGTIVEGENYNDVVDFELQRNEAGDITSIYAFHFRSVINGVSIKIYSNSDGCEYYRGDEMAEYGTVDEAIEEYIFSKKEIIDNA